MDIVEIPSHFMENFVYDARTLQLFMPKRKGDKAAAKSAEALARQVKEDRHLLGALDLELQVACFVWFACGQGVFFSCITPCVMSRQAVGCNLVSIVLVFSAETLDSRILVDA